MLGDLTLEARVRDDLAAFNIPPVDLAEIRGRAERIEAPRAVRRRFPRAAAAVAAALVSVLSTLR